MILTVVFVVLMMFWLFSGYVVTTPDAPKWGTTANAFIPWLCVAILGWVVFGGGRGL